MTIRFAMMLVLAAASAAAQSAGSSSDAGDTAVAAALRANGSLALPQVDARQQVSFQLTLTNVSDANIGNIAVARVGGPHVSLVAADWCDDVAWRSLTSEACYAARILAPRQSITITGALYAAEPLQANVTAVVEWTAPGEAPAGGTATPVRSRAAVPVGTLIVEDWRVRWMRASADFALPLVVLGLGWWFQSRLNKREEARKADETARSEKAEAWRLMLPVSHEYAVKYYAGLVENAKLMVKRTAAISQARPEDLVAAQREGFYAWLMLHARKRRLQQTGAYYFKNHVGELVVPSLFGAYWATFVREAKPADDGVTRSQQSAHRLMDRALEDLGIDETRDGLLGRLSYEAGWGGGALTELFAWFCERTRRPHVEEAMHYLGAYADLLFFEMNKPYAPWFDGTMKIRLATTPEHLAAVFRMLRLSKGPQLSAATLEVDGYLVEAGIEEKEITTAKAAVGTT